MNWARAKMIRAGHQRAAGPVQLTGRPPKPWGGMKFVCPTCGHPRGAKVHRRHMRRRDPAEEKA